MNPTNTTELVKLSHRLLVIDDNPRIHEDIRKILCPSTAANNLADDAAELFGESQVMQQLSNFEIDSAYQGQEGLAMVEKALADSRPYSMAFVDVRMPPGWDGIKTIEHLWQCHADLQVVICTAYSDHSWDEIIAKLGKSDSLLVLKKPFDTVEVLQLAHALTKKWVVTRQAKCRLDDLETIVERRTAELLRANQQLRAEVSRRAAVEKALRESEERFHKSFESALVALAILRGDTLQHADVNASYLTLVGRERDAVLNRTPEELQLPEVPARFAEVVRLLHAGQVVHNFEVNFRRSNHEIRQTLLSVVSVVIGGKPCFLAAALDITEQRRLESQLRQSQKMEAIGQLAAGVAHDFSNLLTVIIGHASIQLTKTQLDKEVQKSLTQVKLAGERASGLTRQLLAFSRKQVLQRSSVDVVKTVATMRKMLGRLVGETIAFEVKCAEHVPCILADESSVEQVLLNLVVNARDAMETGGKLLIQVDTADFFDPAQFRHEDTRAGRFVLLTVTDNGCGMDAETQRRLYEPFFTTKPVGKGTGLGLSTIYGIVKQHEGWIELESQVGAGTTFRVYLPATDEAAQQKETAFIQKAGTDRKECILVVEDEPLVRSYVCEALRDHGYHVLDADCGQKALEVWQGTTEKIELLLTDMVMPNGIGGGDLAKMLRERKKDLKVIYMSGYSSEITGNGDLLNESSNFLPKPFSQGKLLNVVDAAISPVSAAWPKP